MSARRVRQPSHDGAVVSVDEAAQLITVTCVCGHVISRSAEQPAGPVSREDMLAVWRRHCHVKRM